MKQLNFLFVVLLLMVSVFSLSGQEENILDIPKAKNYRAKKDALEYLGKQEIIEKYGKISDQIWHFAELGMQEFKSSALLIKTLEDEGFTIERNVAGMPTCFIATWGSGKPVIGVLGEFDALPMISQKARVPEQDPLIEGGPGHGCGHNMMGTAGTAAVIAVKRSMEENNIKGTIKFFGSPAEETIISRPYMVRAGVFNDVDAVIDNHSSSSFGTGYGVGGNAVISVVFTFKGKTAHSAGAPWDGRSALDAVEIMNVSTNYLREHLNYTQRLHYVVTEGGEAPNVVPDRASVWYYVRNTDERINDMYERVVNCARGAALASGTTLEKIRVLTGVHQQHANRGMAELIQSNIELVGMPEWTEEENEFARQLQKNLDRKLSGYPVKVNKLKIPSGVQVGGGSSDVGEVTLIAPTATLRFPGGVPGAIGHHWSAVASYYGSAAWKGLNAGAKVMAASALDLMTDPDRLLSIRKEFEEYSKDHPYNSFLPDDAEPPLELNKELMNKFRNALDSIGSYKN
ncbi:MAG: amidohydrolase [Marinilabiliaceae bacterium]|jgi:aminobenzoyl-glutamate utilization protein B|nr:amidohydrolase [Marinilabiliaceae bacterium]